jgi:hypothetical protein
LPRQALKDQLTSLTIIMTAESIIDACKPEIKWHNLEAEFHVLSSLPNQFQSSPKAADIALEGEGVLVRVAVFDSLGELELWFPLSGKKAISRLASKTAKEITFNKLGKFESPHDISELLVGEYCEFMDKESRKYDEDTASDLDDDDRIDCPFCGHMHYPGSKTALLDEWIWEGDVCEHTLFVALDLSSFTGFQFRSKLFNQNLGLPDSDETEIEIPSVKDDGEFLNVQEIIEKISLPGMQTCSYSDGGGMACGPCGGGTVTFGFVPG